MQASVEKLQLEESTEGMQQLQSREDDTQDQPKQDSRTPTQELGSPARPNKDDQHTPEVDLSESASMVPTEPQSALQAVPQPYRRLTGNPGPRVSGRKTIIEKMDKYLKDGNNRSVLLHGRRDHGKKKLAVHYARTHEKEYNCIFQLSCIESGSIEADVQNLCYDLKLCNSTEADFGGCVNRLVDHLRVSRPNFLAILTDYHKGVLKKHDAFIERLLDLQNGTVILTSTLNDQSTGLTRRCESIEVTEFTLEESKELIEYYLKASQYTDETCKQLHDFTDHSPSIIYRVVRHIAEQKKTIEEFLSMPSTAALPLNEMDRMVFLSMKQQPATLGLFHLLCFFSPHGPVQLDMLKACLLEALELSTEVDCCHFKSLRELATKLKNCNKIQARSHLKDILETPIRHHLLKVTGKELECVSVLCTVQRNFFHFIQEASDCSCESSFIHRSACICTLEAMESDHKHSKDLALHLKAILGHKNFDESSPISERKRAILARHYVENGDFALAEKLLSGYSQSEELPISFLVWLGRAHLCLGNIEEAIKILRDAASKCRPYEKGVILTHLGSAMTAAGQPAESKSALEKAQKALETEGSSSSDCCYLGLLPGEEPGAYLLACQGKLKRWEMFELLAKQDMQQLDLIVKESIELFEEAFSCYEQSGELNQCQGLILKMYVEVQKLHLSQQTGDPGRLSGCEAIVQGLKEELGQDHYQVGWAKKKIAWIRSESFPKNEAELEKALTEFEEGETLTKNTYSESHRKVANTFRLKALILEKCPSRREEAIGYLQRSEDILKEDTFVSQSPKLIMVVKKLAQLKRRFKQYRFSSSDKANSV